MKKRDIEGALALLMALSDKDAMAKALKDLDAKNDEVTGKLKELAVKEAGVAEGYRMNNAEAKRLSDLGAQLTSREARLRDAEQQHQFTMEGERKGLEDKKAHFDKVLFEDRLELESAQKAVASQQADLDKREKALAKRELDAQKRDEALTAREQAWKQGIHDLETTKAKLKELTA